MTDWDKELAKIDKQLAGMSDADLLGDQARPALPAGKQAAVPARQSSKAPAQAPEPTTGGSRLATFMLYARVLLALALGIGMMFWPYDAKCGSGMVLYLGAVTAVGGSGAVSGPGAWLPPPPRLP